jgi:hypothetical protein
MELPPGTEFFDVDGVAVARLPSDTCVRGDGTPYENSAKVFAEGTPFSQSEFVAMHWADSDLSQVINEPQSELDKAIDSHKCLLENPQFGALPKKGMRSTNWISCKSVYSALAIAHGLTNVHPSVWNTVRRAIVVRMAGNEIAGVGMGDAEYGALEADAYRELDQLDVVARQLVEKRSWYAPGSIATNLARNFVYDANLVNGLSLAIAHNIEKARAKILPDLMRVFT